MNELTWILYLIDIASTFGGFAIATLVISIGMAIVWPVAHFAWWSEDPSYEALEAKKKKRHLTIFRYWYIPLIAIILIIFIPSKTTMYMIAASEVGEMAITSDAGREMISDIQTIIDLQIESLKKE